MMSYLDIYKFNDYFYHMSVKYLSKLILKLNIIYTPTFLHSVQIHLLFYVSMEFETLLLSSLQLMNC